MVKNIKFKSSKINNNNIKLAKKAYKEFISISLDPKVLEEKTTKYNTRKLNSPEMITHSWNILIRMYNEEDDRKVHRRFNEELTEILIRCNAYLNR